MHRFRLPVRRQSGSDHQGQPPGRPGRELDHQGQALQGRDTRFC